MGIRDFPGTMAHCDDGLREIFQAIKAWQKKHNGSNPPSLEALVEQEGFSSWLLICPAGGEAIGRCSYVYRGGDLYEGVPGEMILAYDRRACHRGRRNVLFADGQVRRPREAQFEQALSRDEELRRQLGLHGQGCFLNNGDR